MQIADGMISNANSSDPGAVATGVGTDQGLLDAMPEPPADLLSPDAPAPEPTPEVQPEPLEVPQQASEEAQDAQPTEQPTTTEEQTQPQSIDAAAALQAFAEAGIDVSSWSSVTDVAQAIGAAPEALQPVLTRVVEIGNDHVAQAEAARVSYDEAATGFKDRSDRLDALIDEIDGLRAEGGEELLKPMKERADQAEQAMLDLQASHVPVLVELFRARNPDFAASPSAVQQAMAKAITTHQQELFYGGSGSRFRGGSTIERIEDAWLMTKMQHRDLVQWGQPPKPQAAAPSAPAGTKPRVVSRAAAATSNTSAPSKVDRTPREILDANDHLLKGHFESRWG